MHRRCREARGDASLLSVFLILAVIIVGAMTLAVLVVGNLRGVRDIGASSQAFYAVDTGIERGIYDYYWDVNGPGDPTTCTVTPPGDVSVADQPDVRYQLIVSGGPLSDGCPTVQQLVDGSRVLCMEAIGKVRGGLVRRRVTNDRYVATIRCGR